jgi:hypothetical protein
LGFIRGDRIQKFQRAGISSRIDHEFGGTKVFLVMTGFLLDPIGQEKYGLIAASLRVV